MQVEPNHTQEESDRNDWGVLILFLGYDDRWPWSVDEIIRQTGGKIAALDSIARLRKTGLIHQTADGLIFPTRAALHYTQIKQ
jgi:hypothetical protein